MHKEPNGRLRIGALFLSVGVLVTLTMTSSEGGGFRIGDFDKELWPGVVFQLLVVYDSVDDHPGGAAIIYPVFRGTDKLANPKKIIVGMTEKRYEPWPQDGDFVEVYLEALVGDTWVKPTQVATVETDNSGKKKNSLMPKGARHVTIQVSPGTQNDSFSFWFRLPSRPSKLRLTTLGQEEGPVYEFSLPWTED